MPRENKSQYPILGFLSRYDMSGYDLQKLSKRTGSYYWSDCNPQIYNTLKNLEKEALVASQIDENSGARNRRVYSLTKKGLDFFKSWLKQPAKGAVYRDELLLKVANAQHLSKQQLIKQLGDERLRIEMQLSELEQVLEAIQTSHENREDQPYLLAVYDYIQLQLETKLAWVNKTMDRFK